MQLRPAARFLSLSLRTEDTGQGSSIRTVRTERRSGMGGLLLFGVGYGIASLSCTLPIFLVALVLLRAVWR